MTANLEYDELYKQLCIKTLEKLVEDKRASGEPFDNELLTVLEKSSILFANAMCPIIYKLEKIKLRNPDFEPKRITLSNEAKERIQLIQKLKLIPSGNKIMGIPSVVSSRIKKEVYIKFE